MKVRREEVFPVLSKHKREEKEYLSKTGSNMLIKKNCTRRTLLGVFRSPPDQKKNRFIGKYRGRAGWKSEKKKRFPCYTPKP